METRVMRRAALVVLSVAIGAVSASRLTPSAGAASDHLVTQADMDRWKNDLSNWGRWGREDQKGTINLITAAKRKQAAALIKEGFAISLARDGMTEKAIDNPNPYEDVMTAAGGAMAADRISVSFHGYAHTHFDALAHHFFKGQMYNGYAQQEFVTLESGATRNSVFNDRDGVFTRAILMDMPRLKGVEYLEPGTPIYVEDLEAWEKKAGVKVSTGDALFIRTGRWVRRAKLGAWDIGRQAAGLDASVIPWLRQRDVAIIGSEAALSVVPIPASSQITDRDDYLPVHNFVLVTLGMNVIDDADLERVSEAAAARRRWEFAVTMAPLPLPRATGSPINPTALF